MLATAKRLAKSTPRTLANYARRTWLSRFQPIRPRTLFTAVTYVCDHRCAMCNIWKPKSRPEMSVDDFRRMFDDPLFREVDTLLVSGGEPTVRRDLGTIVAAAAERLPRLARIAMPTNGYDTERVVEAVGEMASVARARGIGLGVAVSLDGVGNDHDRMRRVPHAFDRAAETLRQLTERAASWKIGVVSNCTVTQVNVERLEPLRRWSIEHGYNLQFLPVSFNEHYIENTDLRDKVDLDEDGGRAFERFIEEHLISRDLFDTASFYWHDVLMMRRHGRPRQTPCMFTVDGVLIDAFGDVYYCGATRPIGNWLEAGSVERLFFADENLAYRKYMWSDICPTCASPCFIREVIPDRLGHYVAFRIKQRLSDLASQMRPTSVDAQVSPPSRSTSTPADTTPMTRPLASTTGK